MYNLDVCPFLVRLRTIDSQVRTKAQFSLSLKQLIGKSIMHLREECRGTGCELNTEMKVTKIRSRKISKKYIAWMVKQSV